MTKVKLAPRAYRFPLPLHFLLLLLLAVPACGDQLVEYALGDAAGSGSGSGIDATSGDDPDGLSLGPAVIDTSPAPLGSGISVSHRVTATFDRVMSSATLTETSFVLELEDGTMTIPGDVSYDDVTATLMPRSPLELDTEYRATVTTAATDVAGNPIATDYVWTFTTGLCSQATVVLGAASGFAVLGGLTVTNTGPTTVTGDLGVSPGTAVTGFPPGIVVGMISAGGTAAADAMADLTIAYNDAAGRATCPMGVAGDLGGLTFAPGLYKSTDSLSLTSGNVTLDAGGDQDAVFVFQMATTLIVASNRQVILSGGARAANVYWQVGSSATIGTGAAFVGTILANAAIAIQTGATLTDGRALARTAAVTLDTNEIVVPTL